MTSNSPRKFAFTLKPGAEVCVIIANAHPVNYRYSLDAIVDTTKEPLPDVSAITAFLIRLPGYVQPDATKQAPVRSLITSPGTHTEALAADVLDPRLETLIKSLAILRDEVKLADGAAKASDAPGALTDRDSDKVGFRAAVTAIGSLPDADLHFNDSKLAERHAAELKKVREWAGTIDARLVIADALAASSALLISTRDRLRSDYSDNAASSLRLCKPVAVGRNIFRLQIAKTTTTGSRAVYAKDEKTAPFEIEVGSKYERKVVSLDALTVAVSSRDVPVFAIRNDSLVVRSVSNPTSVRPGVMLSMNPFAFGDADDWILGGGIGIGYSSKDVISDLLVGLTFSYRNAVRVGVGLGKSNQPEKVKGVEVGQRIPANFGDLKDAIENGTLNARAWYMIVTLPGLTLKK